MRCVIYMRLCMCLCWFVLAYYLVNIAYAEFSHCFSDLWSLSAFVQAAAIVIKCHDFQHTVIEFANFTWTQISQWCHLVIRKVLLCSVLLNLAFSEAEIEFG